MAQRVYTKFWLCCHGQALTEMDLSSIRICEAGVIPFGVVHESKLHHSRKAGENMKKILWSTLLVATLLTALPAFAQNPNYDQGPLWRVVYFHIKPGQGEAFWKDFRENLKPTYDSLKKEGLITEYKVWTNVTTDGPNDWDVALGLLFANWAALDQGDARAATIIAKHYGSREAMIEAGKKRSEIREVVSSKLAHEVIPK
jgi:hypothetical protein